MRDRQTICLSVEDGGCTSPVPCHAHHCHHTPFYLLQLESDNCAVSIALSLHLTEYKQSYSTCGPFFGRLSLPPSLFTDNDCSFMFECKLFWQSVRLISKILTFLPCRLGLHVRFYVATRPQMCLFWHFILVKLTRKKVIIDLDYLAWPGLVINIMQHQRNILRKFRPWDHLFPLSPLCPHCVLSREIFFQFW